MIHHDYFLTDETESPSIVADPTTVSHDNTAGNDYFDLTVIPSDMDWTIIKNDTGDGTIWFTVTGSGTGSANNVSVAFKDNSKAGNPQRDATFTISDDAAEADDEVVDVTQMGTPI